MPSAKNPRRVLKSRLSQCSIAAEKIALKLALCKEQDAILGVERSDLWDALGTVTMTLKQLLDEARRAI